ncbi:maleylpyruvate isomerase family mycothiol-dependent enzyme [Streptomyces sp. NPDC088745]|uniref:maleylpyruvate isomerase family mycothiol-dependent enzyme n=1 Tax=Streptomyces sp. NPDC088745 TaxID=3365884 RepID=UPI0038162E99
MNDHAHDLALLSDATDRLLADAAALDDDAVALPSRLPGWSRGHVLAHLARNGDALQNVLAGRPMYVSAEGRDADIERDAPRPLDVQLDDVRATADGFRRAAEAYDDWSRTVELRNGVTDAASRIPFRRLIEIELHHVDLGIGYELEDLPEEFVQREIEFLADRFGRHAQLPSIGLKDRAGRVWTTGGGLEEHVSVEGAAPDLVGWLAGRRDGGALTVTGGALPVLPPL